jgi:AcrR family transcriptional regulator
MSVLTLEALMRITAAEKEDTRERIIAAASEQFRQCGFDAATTRDIARRANIATGTLFNYFTSKEAIVLALVTDALEAAEADFDKTKRPDASLEEDLFLHVTAGLRRLKRHRRYLGVVIQVALSPLVAGDRLSDIDALRVRHLRRVSEILASHGLPDSLPVSVQLYWTLYLGILSYWISDRSPKQEDSRVLIDQSVSMFCDWLRRAGRQPTPAEK